MKKLLILTLWIPLLSEAQTLKISDAQNAKSSTVQCAGKTKQDAQCKVRINPKNPKTAVMDGGGVYYCHFHVKQAKK